MDRNEIKKIEGNLMGNSGVKNWIHHLSRIYKDDNFVLNLINLLTRQIFNQDLTPDICQIIYDFVIEIKKKIYKLNRKIHNYHHIARLMRKLLFSEHAHHYIHLRKTESMFVECVDAIKMSQMTMIQCESFVQCLAVFNKWLVMVAWFVARLHVIHRILKMNSKTRMFLFVRSVELKGSFFWMKIEPIFISEKL